MNEVLSLSLDDFINDPSKAESALDSLTSEQILAIERALCQVKKRRLDTKIAKKTTIKKLNNEAENGPTTELKDGIEWLSFVYSHNRTLKRYSIRTDFQQVDISLMDRKFKSANCVYPRANLPKEQYHGNRWTYETECNELGWKLAWLNKDDIAGKRGLIQRAVDSFRNRYPNMRSRRVARQEKLLNGTLRKRKHRETSSSAENITLPSSHHPKTIAIDDVNLQRFRIKINIESVDLEEINIEFRIANCPFPRTMNMAKPAINSERWVEETMCNELAWKLAWLNPRHLAGKKNLLQRSLDMYRSKFLPSLRPRKNSSRTAVIPVPLTTEALSAQNALYQLTASPAMSCLSGTTESLDFADCFSMTDEDDTNAKVPNNDEFCDLLLQEATTLQDSSSCSSIDTVMTASPATANVDIFEQLINDSFLSTTDMPKLFDLQLLDPLF